MSLAEELQTLERLRSDGALSDEEFEQAKRKLLSPSEVQRDIVVDDCEETLGRAANRYVSFQIFSSILGVIVFLIFLLAVVLPIFRRINNVFPGSSSPHIEWKNSR